MHPLMSCNGRYPNRKITNIQTRRSTLEYINNHISLNLNMSTYPCVRGDWTGDVAACPASAISRMVASQTWLLHFQYSTARSIPFLQEVSFSLFLLFHNSLRRRSLFSLCRASASLERTHEQQFSISLHFLIIFPHFSCVLSTTLCRRFL